MPPLGEGLGLGVGVADEDGSGAPAGLTVAATGAPSGQDLPANSRTVCVVMPTR